MKITVTTTSQTLQQLLSAADYGILRAFYTTGGGGIMRNTGLSRVYIETGKAATSTDSFYLNPATVTPAYEGDVLSFAFLSDILQTQFKTASGTSDVLILF